MSANPSKPPIGSLLAAILLADALIAAKPGPKYAGVGMPAGLAALFPKCDDPTCDACNPTKVGEQKAATEAAEETDHVHVSAAVEIPPDVAGLVGMTKEGFDPDSLEGHTRLLAAAFIINVRKLGEQPVNAFPKAAATLSGIRYVENTVLAALHTFSTLAGR